MPDPTPTPAPAPSVVPASAPPASVTPGAAPVPGTTLTPAPAPTPVPGSPTPAPAVTPPAEVVYALTLPADSLLDPTAVDRATTFAKGSTLAPDTAQKVVEFANAEVAAAIQQQKTDYEGKVRAWESDVKADPDLGGANHTRTLLRTKTVLERFIAAKPEVGKQLQESLNKTGFGNYKPLVAFFDYYGSLMESDQVTQPRGAEVDIQSKAERMFPTSAGK